LISDAPFGGHLGFRHVYSPNLTNIVKYYRWSYREVLIYPTLPWNFPPWKPMLEPVVRHYVKEWGPPDNRVVSYPAIALGPFTVGNNEGLFQFKETLTDSPPKPTAEDPPGTITYWPPADVDAEDYYSGYLDTPSIAPPSGLYEIKLEVFDATGNLVKPKEPSNHDPGTFRFIVPNDELPDHTITTRKALDQELDADKGGFVFKLQIDNNRCDAIIDPPHIEGKPDAKPDACGFLRYTPQDTTITVAFHATHPKDYAIFNFDVILGSNLQDAASVVDYCEVSALTAPVVAYPAPPYTIPPYTGNGHGDFTNDFSRTTLMTVCPPSATPGAPPPCTSCTNAAFSENLHTIAKATTGWGTRIVIYDAHAVRAFALATSE
jgi:hypothetical protein